ncbi:hypothetical protein [Thermoflexus hugenholtzii]
MASKIFRFGVPMLFLLPWAIYTRVIFFPLFYDDLLHLALIDGRSYPELLLPHPGYSYHRPMILLWTSLCHRLLGPQAGLSLHFAVLALHLLNIAWLVRLLHQLRVPNTVAWLGGLIFGLIPYDEQAILVPAFSLHVFQALIFLISGSLFLSSMTPVRKHILLSFLFLIATLNHETVVLLSPFLGGLSMVASRRTWSWIPYGIAGGLYAWIYQFLPRSEPPAPSWELKELAERGWFVLQALAFPLFPGLNRLLGESLRPWIQGIALIWVIAALLVLARRSHGRIGIAGAAFHVMAALPAALWLPTGYFLHGRRLLYLGTIGVASFWGTWLGLPSSSSLVRTLRGITAIAVLVMSVLILNRQVDLYARSLEPLERIRRLPPNATIRLAVLVNFPEWLAYNDRIFPIGSEGALIFGGHLLPGMLFRVNGTTHPDVLMLQADTPFHQPRGYAFQVSGRAADPSELIRWIQQGDLILFTVYGEKGPHTDVLMKPGLQWEDLGVAFMGGPTLRRAYAQRCALNIRLYLEWEGAPNILPDLSLAVHALSPEGKVLAQADGPPWHGAIPFDRIPPGQILPELRELSIPKGAHSTAIRLGVYNWRSGQRLPIQAHSSDVQIDELRFVHLPLFPCPSVP